MLYVRNRLSADAHHFAAFNSQAPARAADELWTGSRLQQALDLRDRGDFRTVVGGLSKEEEDFLSASESRKARLQREAEEQLQRERDAAEKIRQLLLDS